MICAKCKKEISSSGVNRHHKIPKFIYYKPIAGKNEKVSLCYTCHREITKLIRILSKLWMKTSNNVDIVWIFSDMLRESKIPEDVRYHIEFLYNYFRYNNGDLKRKVFD